MFQCTRVTKFDAYLITSVEPIKSATDKNSTVGYIVHGKKDNESNAVSVLWYLENRPTTGKYFCISQYGNNWVEENLPENESTEMIERK